VRLLTLLSLACIIGSFGSCRTAGDESSVKKPPAQLLDINLVLQDHSSELMALPGVVGVAVSELDDHTPCIWVMVREQTAELEKKIPKSLEGHPVVIHLSGEIRPVESPKRSSDQRS